MPLLPMIFRHTPFFAALRWLRFATGCRCHATPVTIAVDTFRHDAATIALFYMIIALFSSRRLPLLPPCCSRLFDVNIYVNN